MVYESGIGSEDEGQTAKASDRHFHGNRLASRSNDLFGFGPIAMLVADAVLNTLSDDCLVIGVEGEWGSGKSTLLSMLEIELEARIVSVVPFAPWLIGSRNALLEELITVLEKAVATQRYKMGDATGVTFEAAKDGLARFRRCSTGVAALGRLAGAAGLVGLPAGGLVGEVLGKLADTMKVSAADTTLEDAKCQTAHALAALKGRIVVLIDDMDRLEPLEAVEVLRLIQAVADFPNVTYVLSYDRRRLADSVRSVLKIKDGSAYLEKLIHIVVPLPQPQPAALMDMFTRGLKEITGTLEFGDRLAHVIVDHIGPRIRTPRGVVRVLDSIRLLWPVVDGRVDMVDLVWLQLVRAQDDRLYRWIESYVAEASRGRPEDHNFESRTRLAEALTAILKDAEPSAPGWGELRTYLPMVGSKRSDNLAEVLLTPSDSKEVFAALQTRRLSSVEHARIYFALLPPAGVNAQAEFEALIGESDDPAMVVNRLLRLSRLKSTSGPALIELVLGLVSTSLPQLAREKLAGISKAIITTADDIIRLAPVADRLVFSRVITDLLARLLELQGDVVWSEVLGDVLKDDVAFDLLTRELPERRNGRAAWIGSDQHAQLVSDHLAAAYALRDDEWLTDWMPVSRLVDAWRIADPAALQSFLDRLISNDGLFLKLVMRRFDDLVRRKHMMQDFGNDIFVSEMQRLWGARAVAHRLEQLLDSQDADADGIKAAIETIRSNLVGEELQNEQDADG